MAEDKANKDYMFGYNYRASARYTLFNSRSIVRLMYLQSRSPTLLDSATDRSFTAPQYQPTKGGLQDR